MSCIPFLKHRMKFSPPPSERTEGKIVPFPKGRRVEDLGRWEKLAYHVALLTPKLIFSGAGWAAGAAVGAAFGGGVGGYFTAGAGDAIGTAIGCGISCAPEYAIRKYILEDPDLNGKEPCIERAKSAALLAVGCFVGGVVFGPAFKYSGMVAAEPIARALITGGLAAGGFMVGMTAARATYTVGMKAFGKTPSPQYSLSWKNFFDDLKLSALIILPAETAFVATSLPLLGITWFSTGSGISIIGKSGLAVLIGGTAGKLGWSAGEVSVEKLLELSTHFKRKKKGEADGDAIREEPLPHPRVETA